MGHRPRGGLVAGGFIVIAAAAFGLAWVLAYFAVITLPIAISLLIAALVGPAVGRLQRIGLPRGLAAGLVMILGITTVGLLLTYVGQQVATGAQDLADSVVTGLGQVKRVAARRPAQPERQPAQRLDRVGPEDHHRELRARAVR